MAKKMWDQLGKHEKDMNDIKLWWGGGLEKCIDVKTNINQPADSL